jgi:hypothetical protein
MANNSLMDTSMDSAGHPARALPMGSAPPTAMFAARLAVVPTISATHETQPVGRPARRCATRKRLATISKPSTLIGNA